MLKEAKIPINQFKQKIYVKNVLSKALTLGLLQSSQAAKAHRTEVHLLCENKL
jgi:hypothetical protein